MRPPLLALAPLATALAWMVTLMIDSTPFDRGPALLSISVGLIIWATTSTVGMAVVGARWAHRLGWAVMTSAGVVAVARPVDPAWVVSLVITILTGLALVAASGHTRRLPPATGPPGPAVLLALVLLGAPLALGLAGPTRWLPEILVALGAPVVALLYSRVVFGGLVAARILWPAAAVGLAPLMEPLVGWVSAIAGIAVVIVAWHPSVKTAYHPPLEVGSAFPIPPELAPGEVLDAARIDDTGRPL